MAGRRFEEFEVGQVLGVGTVGTIYEAYDKTNETPVALKCLLPAVSSDPVIQARFAREMLILEKLSHPNIVEYYGGGKNGDQLFFAMELLKGGTVKKELEQHGVFTWIDAATCGIQICSALQFAHNHGILHRDLKPSNLLFGEDGSVKLVDFGIALDQHEAEITEQGLTVGSHAYMSPEQICGEDGITGHADLYSLGVVMYELLTGRTPFVGNYGQLLKQHLTAEPQSVAELAPDTPPEMQAIIQQMLAKKPEDRPFNVRAVQGVLLDMMNQKLRPTEDDVSAADTIDMGKRKLAERFQRPSHDIPWPKLIALAIGIIAVTLVASLLGK